jgi:hypothetical protein
MGPITCNAIDCTTLSEANNRPASRGEACASAMLDLFGFALFLLAPYLLPSSLRGSSQHIALFLTAGMGPITCNAIDCTTLSEANNRPASRGEACASARDRLVHADGREVVGSRVCARELVCGGGGRDAQPRQPTGVARRGVREREGLDRRTRARSHRLEDCGGQEEVIGPILFSVLFMQTVGRWSEAVFALASLFAAVESACSARFQVGLSAVVVAVAVRGRFRNDDRPQLDEGRSRCR